MKYRTTIKIITEAKDENEATEIAGEYLSGNLTTGVKMNFRTVPARNNVRHAALALVVIAFAAVSLFFFPHTKSNPRTVQCISSDSVIQPPLNTSVKSQKAVSFKDEWRAKHAKEAINSITR